MPILYHCVSARSFRPLWALEELQVPYELRMLPFPPRALQRSYLDLNVLGTVPFLQDGDQTMTESAAMCQYLVETQDPDNRLGLWVGRGDRDHAHYLNWLHHADATLTFPQTISMRYYWLEPTPEKQAVADDYAKWYIARLRRLDSHLQAHEYLVDNRFTIADIAVGYALYLGRALKFDERYQPQTRAYLERLMARPAFQRADAAAGAMQFPERSDA